MSVAGKIARIEPGAAIAGGEVVVECIDFDATRVHLCKAYVNDERAWLTGAAPNRVLVVVPESAEGGESRLSLETAAGWRTPPATLVTGRKLAEDLHLVANPAFDPDDGSLYVTRSGSRGQRMPVTIFRIDANGTLTGLHGEITNPTGIAFDSTGQMYVTSRLDGTVYRVSPFHEVVPFARNLGVATSIAFDRAGRMYVGDRTGTIHRINALGEPDVFALLEPSVSAYHMAFGADDQLYVTGPTVSSYDSVMRVDRDGRASVFYRGLGRPQGLAFDREGNLYVAASLRGRRGIVRITPDGADAELAVAGTNVVGLAFSAAGEMVVATNEAVYSLPLGIYGTLLRER
ncbi:MAG TPA: hypothetical protein VGV59_09190 [Pyrinomonadaceae bacterium]|nr:hypothetical protein [Pyrinomonadaceae bacterium]